MTAPSEQRIDVVALAGGVGGARLVYGLDRTLRAGSLSVVVNTGDDFRHWGLHISPDLDTVMYTLAGLAPDARGWGIEDDTFKVLAEATRRGEPDWFQLGDRDLMTHLSRTASLARGESLTDVTSKLCRALGVERPLLPMCDAPRPTIIVTQDGRELELQQWLVAERAKPAVREVRYEKPALATPAVLRALDAADLVVICPSNPYVSIDPILTLDGVHERLRQIKTIAVSPIMHGKAVKGPLAAMITQLEKRHSSAQAVAMHYGEILDGFIVDRGDGFDADFPVFETSILIESREDRVALAGELIELARRLS